MINRLVLPRQRDAKLSRIENAEIYRVEQRLEQVLPLPRYFKRFQDSPTMRADWIAGIHFKQGFNVPRNGNSSGSRNNGERVRRVFAQSFHLHPTGKIIPWKGREMTFLIFGTDGSRFDRVFQSFACTPVGMVKS